MGENILVADYYNNRRNAVLAALTSEYREARAIAAQADLEVASAGRILGWMRNKGLVESRKNSRGYSEYRKVAK